MPAAPSWQFANIRKVQAPYVPMPKTRERAPSLILCPKCGRELRLLGIESESPGRDLLTFECRTCKILDVRGVSAG